MGSLEPVAAIWVFALGAAIGSFLNVVIYRLPAGISLLWPPSRCPKCNHRLGKTENVPILGWLWLKGKCRWCSTPISKRYPLVEALTALLFVLVFWQFGVSWTTLGYWLFLSWLVALALIDLDTMTLPNVLTQSGLVIGLVFHGFQGWNQAQLPGLAQHLGVGIGSTVLGLWLFESIVIVGTLAFGQPAMGGGDPKLAAMIGSWLLWQSLLLTGLLACALGALIGTGGIALGKLNRRQPLPFGPFLALAAAISLFWGPQLISGYVNLFFPTWNY